MKLYLVRHGSAGIRNDGDPDDTERHLDTVGLRQAARLTQLIGHAAPEDAVTAILTSPAARCVETVDPLAAALGLDIELEPRLFEGSDIDASWALLEELVESDVVAVLCSHGDVIPELIRRAKGRGMQVPGKAGCSKGSLWTLDWDGERFDTGTYLSNPG